MEPNESQKQIINAIAGSCLSVRLRLLNRLIGSIYDAALRPHGIKASQLNILVAVSLIREATSQDLCKRLRMDPSTFSRAAQRMKKKGWLLLEPSGEGKILKVRATAQGLGKIEELHGDWQKAQDRVLEVLGEPVSQMIIDTGNSFLLK